MKGLAAYAEDRVVRHQARRLRYVQAVLPDAATGLVAGVYAQVARDFQLVPPIIVHSPLPRLLAGFWCMMREAFLLGDVPRVHKEAMAAAISWANACPYCVEAHSMMLKGGEDADPHVRALTRWAAGTGSPGNSAPPPGSGAEIVGVAVGFHYINRIVTVFCPDTLLGLPAALGWIERPMRRIAATVIGRRIAAASARPGEALGLLPDAPLPEEFGWAAANPAVAGALARMAAAIGEIEQTIVPLDARDIVLAHVASWNGEAMGLSRSWTGPVSPVARLALLAALAPAQVDASTVAAARSAGFDDAAIVGVVSWAAFTAMRRIASWM